MSIEIRDDREVIRRWTQRLGSFIPDFFAQSDALSLLIGQCAVVLHGSTTLGIDDAFSDLDLWLFAPDEILHEAESITGTRFFSFVLDGKKGHFNLEAIDDVAQRVRRCDLERIAELRQCHILIDFDGVAHELVATARQPMRESVRRAWFCHHYVEMRGSHRNCDNPIERGDPLVILQALVPTLNHALRAAIVLDREPYPYIKWLGRAASRTPTGQRLLPMMNGVLNLLATDALRHPGPEDGHPLGIKLRTIRQFLIESARAGGIDEPWLDRWWVHMTQAAHVIDVTEW